MAGSTSMPNETTPIVDPQTLQFRRAITNDEQGYSVCQRVRQDSLRRNEKQAAIMRKFNDEPPWRQAKLDAAGQGWRRNASTGFMSSMVKRILPAYEQMVDNAQYLTTSTFPGNETTNPDQSQKESNFRLQITKTIRGWSGWQPFKGQVILEDVLFGYSGAGWTDEVTWEPRFLRQDEAYFPDGTSQDAKLCPLWVLEQNFQIHEMAAYLVNPAASAAAGWNIDNIVTAINDAKPENRTSGTNQDVRKYEDVVRESSMGASYSQGVKVVKTVHLFVQEVSGKVSHYIYNDRNNELLFVRLDRFDSMEDNLALLAIEVGNGKLAGSKGAGRILYNTHVSIEQARNLITDNLYLSGLLILKRTDESSKQQALQVIHPIAIIGKGFEVAGESFQIDTDAYFAIDRQHTQIAELQVGAFMPGQLTDTSGEKRTASEINYTASIEQQLREGLLARFYAQFQMIVWQMQKRICSIANITKANKLFEQEKTSLVKRITQGMFNLAKAIGKAFNPDAVQIIKADPVSESGVQCCLQLLRKGLTPQEIYDLGQAPSFDLTQDTAQDLSNAMDALAADYKGDPNVNQFELKRRHIASKVGETMADELIIPQEDNTVTAEATRQQIIELFPLLTGETVPISPRDNDMVHLQVLQQKAETLMKNPQAITPQMIPVLQNILTHAQQHLTQGLTKAGGDKTGFEEAIQFITGASKALGTASAGTASAPPAGITPAGQSTAPPPADAAAGPTNINNPTQEIDNPAIAAQDKPLSRGPITPQS